MVMNRIFRFILVFSLLISPVALSAQDAGGVRMPIPKIAFDIDEAKSPKDVALSLQILFLLTILTLAPSIILMTTAFTRVVIVLDFVKRALSLQQMPPEPGHCGPLSFSHCFYHGPHFPGDQ